MVLSCVISFAIVRARMISAAESYNIIFAPTTILSSLSRRHSAGFAFGINSVLLHLPLPQGIRIEMCSNILFQSIRNFSFLSKLNRAAFGTNHTECDAEKEGRKTYSFDGASKSLPLGVRGSTYARAHNEVVAERYTDTGHGQRRNIRIIFILVNYNLVWVAVGAVCAMAESESN